MGLVRLCEALWRFARFALDEDGEVVDEVVLKAREVLRFDRSAIDLYVHADGNLRYRPKHGHYFRGRLSNVVSVTSTVSLSMRK
jgi:hypothetical protein